MTNTIENLKAFYNTVNNDIKANNINIDTYKYYNEILNSFENVITKLYSAVKLLDNVSICEYNKSQNTLLVRFNKNYSKDISYYSIGISHNYYVKIDMETLTYGTFDWDGFTQSYNGTYDTVKSELRKAGVKLAFASDAKKSFNNVIKFLKKSEIYKEFIEIYNIYKNSQDNLFGFKITEKLENDANNILIESGFKNEFNKIYKEGRYYVRIIDNKARLYVVGDYPKTKIAKLIKTVVENNSNAFELKKQEGTIVPILFIKLN